MNLLNVKVSSFSVMLAVTKQYSVSWKWEEFEGRGKVGKKAQGDSMGSAWKICQ